MWRFTDASDGSIADASSYCLKASSNLPSFSSILARARAEEKPGGLGIGATRAAVEVAIWRLGESAESFGSTTGCLASVVVRKSLGNEGCPTSSDTEPLAAAEVGGELTEESFGV